MTGPSDSLPWQFWIDVGGTFTDCLAQSADGNRRHLKVLSSSTTKGTTTQETWDRSVGTIISDRDRTEVDQFWTGYDCRLLDALGNIVAESKVVGSIRSSRSFELDRVLDAGIVSQVQSYELVYPGPSPIFAIRKMLALPLNQPLPAMSLQLGTTKGTNALLTRSGARVAYLTTTGFRDALLIGDQARPDLFAREIVKPVSLFESVFEIKQRMTHDGSVIESIDSVEVRQQLLDIQSRGYRSLAICFLHAYRFPEHEQLVSKMAREIGFDEISVSHQVTPTIKLVSRGQTTVLDAYLNPLLRSYLASIRKELTDDSKLRMITSTGALVSQTDFTGKESILSGPAGGVVGFSKIASQMGYSRSIGLDMGGTSTDVARYDGEFERQFETTKAGVRIVHPILAIETVAAGGGSICSIQDGRLTVGPGSAGADPGPACYGRGGPLTITDINLFLGRINTDEFPFRLDLESVTKILEQQIRGLNQKLQLNYRESDLAEGYFRIAVERMAKAIHSISVARGYDPREYTLVAFGGASPQMACAVAEELDISKVVVHPLGSILSAVGISLAEPTDHQMMPVDVLLKTPVGDEIKSAFEKLAQKSREHLLSQGGNPNQIETKRYLDLRYVGTDAYLTIGEPVDGDFARVFQELHHQQFGYLQHRPIEIVSLRIQTTAREQDLESIECPANSRSLPPRDFCTLIIDHEKTRTPQFDNQELQPGDVAAGPALIYGLDGSLVIDAGWVAQRWNDGRWLLEKQSQPDKTAADTDGDQGDPDPVLLEVFESNFGVIAEQMGITLQKTAISVNVKERLDFSCALFNHRGELVVNAPHIPVHLGAMSETVKGVIDHFNTFADGDVIVTNDPYGGGSHLPDVTVITPVFVDGQDDSDFFVANRCHHAEIGGLTPGSMPPAAECLGQEGVLISNFKLIDAGVDRFERLRELLTSAEYPSRTPDDNVADIVAQVAANRRGSIQLQRLAERYGRQTIIRYMEHCLDAAEQKMRNSISSLAEGEYSFADRLDCGAEIAVKMLIDGDQMTIDFAGTSDVQSNNLNANRGIVMAAIIYCLRLLINQPLSLNDGIRRPIQLKLPVCFLNPTVAENPLDSPPVVGGNVETSQRIVDVLLGALKIAAASQGTMNNLLIGNDSFGYYETICGGSGATAVGNGADAVHTHMTNTRITDPEILETRFPMRVRRFEIRENSGGRGDHSGGNGVIREIECLEDLQVSIISNRRNIEPFGLSGGNPGRCGKNLLIDVDGSEQELPEQTSFAIRAGQRIRIETPGGGGFGKPSE